MLNLANELVSRSMLYDENNGSRISEEEKDAFITVYFTSGLIGNSTKKHIENMKNNTVVISPNTITRCISDSLAIVDVLSRNSLPINIFSTVKELSYKLAEKYNL